jgi:hypothetical protein
MSAPGASRDLHGSKPRPSMQAGWNGYIDPLKPKGNLMSISTRTWAIIGGAAALVIVPAGVTFAVVAAHDEFRPGISQRAPAREGQQDDSGMMRGGAFGNADRAGTRDQIQARDGSNCDGDGPIGQTGNHDQWGPGMMGGRGQGAMDGSGAWNR